MVKINYILKSCIVAGATFFSFHPDGLCQAREANDFGEKREFYNSLFLHRSWDVFFSPNVTVGAKITHVHPEARYQLKSSPQISFAFGVQQMTPLNTRMGFTTGLFFGLVGRNATYVVPGAEVGADDLDTYPFTGPIARERDVAYFAVPGQLEYRWLTSKKYYYFSNLGLSLRFAMFNSSSNGDMEVMEVRLRGNKKPFINLHGGGGIGFVLRNADVLKVGMLLNVDPSYIAKGPHRLETETSFDEGTYCVKGTSLGLSLIYTRTKVLRRD